MDTWLKMGTLKKSRDRNEPSTSASSVEMCTDHGAEYIEKPDQTDSEDNERSEEAGTEKPNRDVLKTKHRQRLDAENDLRVKLSSITPNFDDLCADMQAQPSH